MYPGSASRSCPGARGSEGASDARPARRPGPPALRALRPAQPARRGGDGAGLPGRPRGSPGLPQGAGDQADPPRPDPQERDPGPGAGQRGPPGRPAAPPEHRRRLRVRRGRRGTLPGHGVRPGADPGRPDRQRPPPPHPAPGQRGPGPGAPDLRRARLRPRDDRYRRTAPEPGPPGPEAGQHHPVQRRAGQDHGLRHRPLHVRPAPDHRRPHGQGHPALHVPRAAGHPQGAGPALGHLRRGLDPLRGPHRQAPAGGTEPAGDHVAAGQLRVRATAGSDRPAATRDPPGPRALSGPGPGGPVPGRRRAR